MVKGKQAGPPNAIEPRCTSPAGKVSDSRGMLSPEPPLADIGLASSSEQEIAGMSAFFYQA